MEDIEFVEIPETARRELAAKVTLDFMSNLEHCPCLEEALANTILSSLKLGCKLGRSGFVIPIEEEEELKYEEILKLVKTR